MVLVVVSQTIILEVVLLDKEMMVVLVTQTTVLVAAVELEVPEVPVVVILHQELEEQVDQVRQIL